jgi:hypothetical protein
MVRSVHLFLCILPCMLVQMCAALCNCFPARFYIKHPRMAQGTSESVSAPAQK